jgi:predicted amidohydrolase YtcJ
MATANATMLIQNAQVWKKGLADVRIAGGRIVAIGALAPLEGEHVLAANGGALLPGLHDHHIHLAALAARQASVLCGPPNVNSESELAIALDRPGTGWLRGVGYHESVAGLPDVALLDRLLPDRPLRIQHRSGRMWFFNSLGLGLLSATSKLPSGFERENGRFTGRLFDSDLWLRKSLGSIPPPMDELSRSLAGYGITGATDMTPQNDPAMAAHFESEQARGALAQNLVLAGTLSLAEATWGDRLHLGPAKLHLHETTLPDPADIIDFIRAAHDRGRSVAVHCTTEVELVFALHGLENAGILAGDRIEHASIAPDPLVEAMTSLGLAVIVQPHFISERGDQYLADVAHADLPWLYRLKSLAASGITLAGGSDAPFGEPDPWAAMAAATTRTTHKGVVMGPQEALSPEAALGLFLADPLDLARERGVEIDERGDLCLLNVPWETARRDLSQTLVCRTVIDGVDQTPAKSDLGIDALA